MIDEDAPVPPAPAEPASGQRPPRHGCLTILLLLFVVGNSAAALTLLAGGAGAHPPEGLEFLVLVAAGLAIVNVIAALALFGWKRAGLRWFLFSSVALFVVSMLIELPVLHSVSWLVQAFLLLVALRIGGERRALPHLR